MDGSDGVLRLLVEKYGFVLTLAEVAEVLRCERHTARKLVPHGWYGSGRGLKMKAGELARQMTKLKEC